MEAVADGFGQVAFAADPAQAGLQIILEVREQWRALRLPHGQPDLGALATDLALDGEDRADLLQRLTCDRRFGPDVLVEQIASGMGPTRDRFQARAAGDRIRLVELVEAGIGVGAQEAGCRRQQGLGVLALAVGRVAIEGRRRIERAPSSFIAHHDP